MSLKQRRQQAIGRLIGQQPVASQPQLLDLLGAEGIAATQATVSRDLEELGVIRVRVPGGQSVYALPELESDRFAPFAQLRRVLGEWVGEVAASGNLVVVRTPPGCAHVVASALDRSGLDGLLGTVAGDDTLMCVAAATTTGDELADRLRQLAGLCEPSESSSERAVELCEPSERAVELCEPSESSSERAVEPSESSSERASEDG